MDNSFDRLIDLTQVNKAPKLAINNRDKINEHTMCGCYFCLRVFRGNEIKEWCDKNQTVLCPNCNIDSVVPNETNMEFLVSAHERWFTEQYNKTEFKHIK